MSVAPASPAPRRRRRWLLALLLVPLFGALPWLARQPEGHRDWASDHERPATITRSGSRIAIRDVRDFRYAEGGTALPAYYDATYDLDSLTSVWFVLTAFSKRSRAPAHTLLSFGFADGRYVAISVEARRERDERYGIVKGMFRSFELIYVIGDERDLIGRRAVVDGDDTFLFPVNVALDKARTLLADMLDRAQALQTAPEWYHSLFNSCASNIVDHANRVTPGRIPAGLKTLVPGFADDVAQSLGLIAAPGDSATLRQRFRINEAARAALAVSDSVAFSASLRAAIAR